MPKKRTSFALSEEALILLVKLAEKLDRSQAGALEQLIKEAAKKHRLSVDKKDAG